MRSGSWWADAVPGSCRRRCGHWTVLWTLGTALSSGTSLTVLLDRLEPLTGRLWDLYADGHRFDWFCLVGSHATERAVELDRPVLTRLITLPGDLLLDVYPADEDAE